MQLKVKAKQCQFKRVKSERVKEDYFEQKFFAEKAPCIIEDSHAEIGDFLAKKYRTSKLAPTTTAMRQ